MTISSNGSPAQDGTTNLPLVGDEVDVKILKPTERMFIEKTLLKLYPRLQKHESPFWKWLSSPIIPEFIVQHTRPDLRRIVEIGCGDGLFSNILSLLFPDTEIIGIDSNAAAIAEARATIGYRQNLKFVCANAQVLAEIPCDRIIYNRCMSRQSSLYAFKKLILKTSSWIVDEGDVIVKEAPWPLLNNLSMLQDLFPKLREQKDIAAAIRSVLAEVGYPAPLIGQNPGLLGLPSELFYRMPKNVALGNDLITVPSVGSGTEWQDWGEQSNDSLVGFLFSNGLADFTHELK